MKRDMGFTPVFRFPVHIQLEECITYAISFSKQMASPIILEYMDVPLYIDGERSTVEGSMQSYRNKQVNPMNIGKLRVNK